VYISEGTCIVGHGGVGYVSVSGTSMSSDGDITSMSKLRPLSGQRVHSPVVTGR
jgi:hypothetical protein